MPTTHPDLAYAICARLQESSTTAALLHPLPPKGSGLPVTDVDLVLSRRPTQPVIEEFARDVLAPLGLTAILGWPYDHDAVAIFATDSTARCGVHLDLVHDMRGCGKLGVRYARFLEGPLLATGHGGTTVGDLDQRLYLLRKRHWKQQRTELAGVRAEAHATRSALLARASEVLVPAAQRDVTALLADAEVVPRFSRTLQSRAVTAARLTRRLLDPIGSWVHLQEGDRDLATLVATRFGNTLVHSRAIDLTTSSAALRARVWLREIAPIRWRPGLAVSFGPPVTSHPRPDLTLGAARLGVEDASGEIVRWLSCRFRMCS